MLELQICTNKDLHNFLTCILLYMQLYGMLMDKILCEQQNDGHSKRTKLEASWFQHTEITTDIYSELFVF